MLMYFGERWSLQFRKNIFFPYKYCCLKKDPSLAPSGGDNVICKNPERPRKAANQRRRSRPTGSRSFLVHSAGTLMAGTRGPALTCYPGLQEPKPWRNRIMKQMSIRGLQSTWLKENASGSRAKEQRKLNRRNIGQIPKPNAGERRRWMNPRLRVHKRRDLAPFLLDR